MRVFANSFFVRPSQTSGKNQVDHQAAAYVAPRRTLAEANGHPVGNGASATDGGKVSNGTANGTKKAAPAAAARVAKWGGAEICPRCSKSVRSVPFPKPFFSLFFLRPTEHNVHCQGRLKAP